MSISEGGEDAALPLSQISFTALPNLLDKTMRPEFTSLLLPLALLITLCLMRALSAAEPATKAPGVTLLREEAGVSVFRIGSGEYRFTSR